MTSSLDDPEANKFETIMSDWFGPRWQGHEELV